MVDRANGFVQRSLTLRHLRLLLALDNLRQVRRVADALHISQPAVSKALAEIESGIGAPLFERTPRGLVPTARGACLVRYAQIVTGEVARAAEELAEISRGIASTLSVGVMHGCMAGVVPAALQLCRQRQPGLLLQVTEGAVDGLMQQLRAGRLDLVVGARVERSIPPGVRFTPLLDEPLVVVCGVEHPLARARALTWPDLLGQRWVMPPRSARARDAVELTWRRMGLTLPEVAVETVSTDMIVSLVTHSTLLALLTRQSARTLVAAGLLAVLDVAPAPVVIPIGTLRGAETSRSSAAALLEACLAEVCVRV